MEINIVELIVQAGALGLTALLLIGLWKFGGKFVNRLMDNLDLQARNHEESIKVQAEVARGLAEVTETLSALCKQMDDCEDQHGKRSEENLVAQAEMIKAFADLAGRLQAHEKRAQARHEQQSKQADERHTELIGALKGLNGK